MESSERTLSLIGGGLLLLLVLYWFWAVALVPHTTSEPPWIFLDNANLIFHEAGHIIFMPFGQFLYVAGGSLMQFLVPAVALGSFIRQGQALSAGFSLFWLGESGVNLSYYIADARTQNLPLITGDPSTHDWTWLLTQTNLLSADTTLGAAVRLIAILTMLTGISWMAWSMYQVYQGKTEIKEADL